MMHANAARQHIPDDKTPKRRRKPKARHRHRNPQKPKDQNGFTAYAVGQAAPVEDGQGFCDEEQRFLPPCNEV